jgi:hypothetical protein
MKHLLISSVLLGACSSTAAQPAKPQSASDVVATVGSTSITLAEVDDGRFSSRDRLPQPEARAGAAAETADGHDDLVASKLMDQRPRPAGSSVRSSSKRKSGTRWRRLATSTSRTGNK